MAVFFFYYIKCSVDILIWIVFIIYPESIHRAQIPLSVAALHIQLNRKLSSAAITLDITIS